jgi:hypothetical protein
MNSTLTPAGTFYFFTLVALVGLWFSIKFVPETKGKSLEEISEELTQRFATGRGTKLLAAAPARDDSGLLAADAASLSA